MNFQALCGRYMLFNLISIIEIDWSIVTARRQRQVDIDNVGETARQVMHDYAIGNLVYVENTGIYQKLDYKKQGQYIITEVFTRGIVQLQRGNMNKRIHV